MVYGRSKAVPPPTTPFEEFMATASDKMIAAKLEAVELLRELPPAAWIAIGVVILVLAASSLNLRGKKKSAADTAAVAPAADAAADVAAPAKPAVAVNASAAPTGGQSQRRAFRKQFAKATGLSGFFSGKKKIDEAAGKLGVDAPPVSMEVIDKAAELTKGKIAEGGTATDNVVKAAVAGPAQ